MKFDLHKIDFTQEVSQQLKAQYDKNVELLIQKNQTDIISDKEIVLYHGTTIGHLNRILLDGLLPNKDSNISNFEGELKANNELVYLTNKWHYWYAHQASVNMVEESNSSLYLPCYIECKVKESNLIIDEDFFHSTYVKNRIKTALKKQNQFIELNFIHSLNEYATVAHMGKIERKDIMNFTILANLELFKEKFVSPQSQYGKDLIKWASGKGKGSLKLMDLFKLEDDANNLFFNLDVIPANNIIKNILPKENNEGFSLQLAEIINRKDC